MSLNMSVDNIPWKQTLEFQLVCYSMTGRDGKFVVVILTDENGCGSTWVGWQDWQIYSIIR